MRRRHPYRAVLRHQVPKAGRDLIAALLDGLTADPIYETFNQALALQSNHAIDSCVQSIQCRGGGAHFGMMTQGPARSTLKVTAYVPLPLSEVDAFQEPAPAIGSRNSMCWARGLYRCQ